MRRERMTWKVWGCNKTGGRFWDVTHARSTRRWCQAFEETMNMPTPGWYLELQLCEAVSEGCKTVLVIRRDRGVMLCVMQFLSPKAHLLKYGRSLEQPDAENVAHCGTCCICEAGTKLWWISCSAAMLLTGCDTTSAISGHEKKCRKIFQNQPLLLKWNWSWWGSGTTNF